MHADRRPSRIGWMARSTPTTAGCRRRASIVAMLVALATVFWVGVWPDRRTRVVLGGRRRKESSATRTGRRWIPRSDAPWTGCWITPRRKSAVCDSSDSGVWSSPASASLARGEAVATCLLARSRCGPGTVRTRVRLDATENDCPTAPSPQPGCFRVVGITDVDVDRYGWGAPTFRDGEPCWRFARTNY